MTQRTSTTPQEEEEQLKTQHMKRKPDNQEEAKQDDLQTKKRRPLKHINCRGGLTESTENAAKAYQLQRQHNTKLTTSEAYRLQTKVTQSHKTHRDVKAY
jgi:hypothetical protein